ncbi:CDP-diacylglycerol diphosphatase [Nostoc sp. TCL26-01]|uniref:CDP-diacylglycerol diphosphatase n=1 Tax=Nostoc sp. TCL26-01 TaxID=2576904 RepID=UPI0015C10E6B|nr:CDP-diacylglycerol diphosphatase [Nostoc sp. TCL26-01]
MSITTIANSQPSDRDYLWKKVQTCIKNQQDKNNPSPCLYVDLQKKYAVANGSHQVEYLLLPTNKVSGIDDPQILKQNSPNYWQYTWEKANEYIPQKESKVKYRNQIGLAINSQESRMQDQLHIHMSCIDKDVSFRLDKAEQNKQITSQWTQTPNISLKGHQYSVKILENDSLKYNNPFHLVAKIVTPSEMGHQSIAIAGRKKQGFYIIKDQSQGLHKAAAEELLDENCQTQK